MTMPVYRALNGAILTPLQFDARSKEEAEIATFAIDSVRGGPTPFRAFRPVDFGKPLSIVIRRIYTGRYPEQHLSSGTLDASKYQFDATKGLVQTSDSSPYRGDEPVVVISIDGAHVDGVSNFTPLLVSSSVLGRLFNQKENSEAAMDTILDAVKLANDRTFRKKAEETKAKLDQLPSNDPQRKRLEEALKAFNQNIGQTRLQLARAVTALEIFASR
jgi:hypothetical protein